MNTEKQLYEKLEGNFIEKVFPKGMTVKVAPQSLLKAISIDLELDMHVVEQAAYSAGAVPERYVRNLTTFTQEEQAKLFSSKVAMVGLGGLGGHMLESLARAGVGHIVACDGDIFEPSNLNRQFLSSESTLLMKKSAAAAELVKNVNPAVLFEVESQFLEGGQFDEFVSDSDIVVDCLGGLKHRSQLKDAAFRNNIPLVTACVAGWAGIVATVYPGDTSPADFFGDNNGLEEALGTPIPAISTAVGVQSAEILKILSGKGAGLAGKALMFDLSGMIFDTVTL
ncbi:HesA/MoeB/ThiF family protein [Maridesulfovibrio frigidus]|uniref:HesA/MoeB/ThiF family protein n=1 Tax=Maridesulfovibrio frigidus TaxID=340956 RepID=UPI0004E153AA|nr:HesA/MoeB/ThiF family protein [Maridesulfovibrio frigidus]